MLELFLLSLLLGAIAGLLAGLFGLGGGVVVVPGLVWLFSWQHFPEPLVMIMSVATSLATILLTSVSSVIAHYRLGAMRWPWVFRLAPGIALGAALGAIVADFIAADYLRNVFIAYLLYVALRMARSGHSSRQKKRMQAWLDYIVSVGIGLLSSILGIGGGTLTVPYLVGRRLPMKNAVAISSACGLPIAIAGTVVYIVLGWEAASTMPEWSVGYIYLPALIGVVICSVSTAPVGAKLANRLEAQKLKRYFSIVIFLIALKMMAG